METVELLVVVLGGLLISATTWLTCFWWYGRRMQALSARLQKAEKARQFSMQQTLVARKQIEALQKDLASQHRALADAHLARQRSRHLEEVLRESALEDDERENEAPAHGFADTQPMA